MYKRQEKEGIRTYTCERCGGTSTESIAKLTEAEDTTGNADKTANNENTTGNADKTTATENAAENVDQAAATGGAVRTDDVSRNLWITLLLISACAGLTTICLRRRMKR